MKVFAESASSTTTDYEWKDGPAIAVLAREGYIGVILVSDSANFEQNRKQFEEHVLNNLTVNSGYTYGEFDASLDKKSELGLTGLILGGAGVAVAQKVGLLLLLKKGWIFIVAALAGAFGWLRRKLTGRKDAAAASPTESSEVPALSPAEEAYQQHAAGQESLSSAADDDKDKRLS